MLGGAGLNLWYESTDLPVVNSGKGESEWVHEVHMNDEGECAVGKVQSQFKQSPQQTHELLASFCRLQM